MAITIGWRLQLSWRGYDTRCRDHCSSTGAGHLLMRQGSQSTCYRQYLGRNKGLPSGPTGSHLEVEE